MPPSSEEMNSRLPVTSRKPLNSKNGYKVGSTTSNQSMSPFEAPENTACGQNSMRKKRNTGRMFLNRVRMRAPKNVSVRKDI